MAFLARFTLTFLLVFSFMTAGRNAVDENIVGVVVFGLIGIVALLARDYMIENLED